MVGSVFVSEAGDYGHVGIVTAVNGNRITIKDMNGGEFAPTFEQAGEAPFWGPTAGASGRTTAAT